MSDPWADEGFGAESDWGGESLESDLEEEEALDPAELDDEELSDDEDDGES